MKAVLARLTPQPLVSLVVSLLALGTLGWGWSVWDAGNLKLHNLLLALALGCAVVATYQFPTHLGRWQKVEMTSAALFLIAVLIPDVMVASMTAGLSVLAAEMLVRGSRCNFLSDVMTATCRWTLIIFAGATFSHMTGSFGALSLLGTGLILWVGDNDTCPLVVGPMTGERPFRLMSTSFRSSGLIEGTQYLLGKLGALGAAQQMWALALLVLPTVLVYQAMKNVKELQSHTHLMLENMADAVDLRDPYTGGHSQRVAAHAAAILHTLGLQGPEAEIIVLSARLHDIGKIGVPDAVLNKPARLTPEEEAIMHTHPDKGADLLQRYPDFARGAEIVRHHHESWDGTGYPARIKGTDIPFGGRVIAVADSYDAMTTDRPYRNAMTQAKASMILREGRGQQWDPQVVDAFLQTLEPKVAPAVESSPAPSLYSQPTSA